MPRDKVLAYALYSLSAANDPSNNNPASGNCKRLAQGLSREALMRAQELSRQLAKPGNFAEALDSHLAQRSKKPGKR